MTNDDREGDTPAAPLGQEPGADAWVDQWVSLFGDEDTEPLDQGRFGEPEPVIDRVGSIFDPSPPESREPSPEPPPPSDERSALDDDVATIEAWQRAQERSRRQARVRANQRAARQMRQLVPERHSTQVTITPATIASARDRQQSLGRLGWVAGALVVVIIALGAYLFIGPGTQPGRSSTSTPELAGPDTTHLDLTVGAEVAPASIQELALSTVQVVGLDDELQPQCAGSGVIVADDGTILTNAHVVLSDEKCRFTSLGIGVTVDSNSPPELLYRAEVVLLRLGVDLAVLRVAGPLTADNGAAWPRTFPAAPLGDSDTVELGDPVRILGYPVIGGDTITLTTGTVSGFTSQVGLGTQALIKTDATISAGNSGGLAIDASGRVVGIPTKARASERGPAVDCRPVSDTNDDGFIDEGDTCVSVGGFVNGIRPINLSFPLLAAAGISDSIGASPVVPEPEPLDLAAVELTNPRFSLGVTDDDLPSDVVVTAVAGIPQLCFFVDWEGIPLGASWDGAWYVDNVIQVGRAGYTGRVWDQVQNELPFSLCIEADGDEGLPAGVYEIALYLDRQVAFVEGLELTGTPVETVETTWTNETGRDLCGLAINPAAASRQVGLNQLPEGLTIPPTGEWTTELPIGSVVVEAYGCDDEPVANRLDGQLVVEKAAMFQIES